ncbi:MAG: hypothetical protein Q7L55_08410 [Actinomycetota bacterium]|nr:hypothetical protein [Actinomycetota bacterium]
MGPGSLRISYRCSDGNYNVECPSGGTHLGHAIVSIEENNPPNMTAINNTLTGCGLPSINPTIVNDPQNPPGPSPDNNGEPDLDLVVLGAALPKNASLALVNTGGDIFDALQLAAQQCGVILSNDPAPGTTSSSASRGPNFPSGGCIISVSYGSPEQFDSTMVGGQNVLVSNSQEASDLLADLADLGVIVVVAAGDTGSGGCLSTGQSTATGLTPTYPASDPSALAVGGTQWATSANGPYQPGVNYTPIVWKSANAGASSRCSNFQVNGQPASPGAGGGGISSVFPAISAQESITAQAYPTFPRNRMVPDVAALAGTPGYAMFMTNPQTGQLGWSVDAGTSAAAPSVAAGIANINAILSARGLGPISNGGGTLDVHTVMYSPAYQSSLTDITIGDNSLFGLTMNGIVGWSAMTGFDMTSGMGVPNFGVLANALVGSSGRSAALAPLSSHQTSSVQLLGGGVRLDTSAPSTPAQLLPVQSPKANAA